jgi:hypothetical protein
MPRLSLDGAALLSIGLALPACVADRAPAAPHAAGDPSAVVADMAKDLKRCYDVGRVHDSKMSGSVKLVVAIGATGQVASVTLGKAFGLSLEVLECVADRVQAASFAPPKAGSATLVVPLEFSPENGDAPSIGRIEQRR